MDIGYRHVVRDAFDYQINRRSSFTPNSILMAELGRPTVMTPETIAKLEEGFLLGLTDREASLYANINPATLYRFCEEHPDFSDRKELLKEQVKIRAKQNIVGAINQGDKLLSQWYLERRDPEYKPKQENDNKGQVIIKLQSFGTDDSLSVVAGASPTQSPSEPSQVQGSRMAPQSEENNPRPQ